MKLFLGGGGGGADSIELDKRFVATLDLSKPLLYFLLQLILINILIQGAWSGLQEFLDRLV